MRLRQNGFYLLLGLTMTLAIVAAVLTVGGVLASIALAVAPGKLVSSLRGQVSQLLATVLILAATFQTAGWFLLPVLGFVPSRQGRIMQRVMAAIALLMFVMLLVSLR